MLFVTLFWEIVALAIETELNSKYFELCFQVFVLSKFGDRRAKLVDKNFPKVIFRGHFEIVSEHLFSGIYVKIISLVCSVFIIISLSCHEVREISEEKPLGTFLFDLD